MTENHPVTLPPLSISTLAKIHKVEGYLIPALHTCKRGHSFDIDRACEILAACAASELDVRLDYYSLLPDFSDAWIGPIKTSTFQSVTGFLPNYIIGAELLRIYDAVHSALEVHIERSMRLAAARAKTPETKPALDEPNPISKQLDDLRKECRMTVEELAAALELNLRSVYRNISGQTQPRTRQIAAYEKLFSEKLGRAVHLNTPPKK